MNSSFRSPLHEKLVLVLDGCVHRPSVELLAEKSVLLVVIHALVEGSGKCHKLVLSEALIHRWLEVING